MIPITNPDKPVLAPLSWFTADRENDPALHIFIEKENSDYHIDPKRKKLSGQERNTDQL